MVFDGSAVIHFTSGFISVLFGSGPRRDAIDRYFSDPRLYVQ
jgi:hypothetical protein